MPFDSAPITSPVIDRLRWGRARVERGWCQGSYSDGDRVCALGGVRGDDQYDNSPAAQYLKKALGGTTAVCSWNDAFNRTQADVLALYDKAIELAVADALN